MLEKVALVVGGGGGFGGVIARALHEKAYRIALADIDFARVEAAARSLGNDAFPLQVDLTNEQSVVNMVNTVIKKESKIDLLFLAHGVTAGRTLMHETSFAEWDFVLKTNLTGSFFCLRSVVRKMIEQKSGCVISLSTGREGRKLSSPYISSKWGLDALVACIAQEVRDRNIGVYSVSPGGYSATKFHDNSYELMHFKNHIPEKDRMTEVRAIRPEVIVPLCLYLIEDSSLALSGSTLNALEWNEENGLGRERWFVPLTDLLAILVTSE
jgi:NAD(P)-dependent dehydrogenase (short-subunit alcohol dehydrogenase family)